MDSKNNDKRYMGVAQGGPVDKIPVIIPGLFEPPVRTPDCEEKSVNKILL